MSTIQYLILCLSLISLPVIAQEPGWNALTVKAPECEGSNVCRVSQSNGVFEVIFSPVTKEGRRHLKKVQIRDLTSRKIQDFDVPEMNNLPADEHFKLYKIKLRPNVKDLDLALHAFNSAREGEVFYYFIYDRKEKKFVMSDGTFPKLKFDPKTQQYLSELQGSPFVLNSSLQLSAVQPKP